MLITDYFFSLLALQSRLPCSSKMPAYDYPEGNRLLIDTLNLQRMSSLSVFPLSPDDFLFLSDPCERRPQAPS